MMLVTLKYIRVLAALEVVNFCFISDLREKDECILYCPKNCNSVTFVKNNNKQHD